VAVLTGAGVCGPGAGEKSATERGRAAAVRFSHERQCRHTHSMEFTRCPYDASPIEAETYSGGSALLSCSTCGAAWEWHNAWLRRVREPDRDAVRRARAGNPAFHDRPARG
jgi:hypothetical protein